MEQGPQTPTTLIIDEAVTGLVLYQDVFLAPGRYRFSVAMPAPVDAGAPYAWTVSCRSDGTRLDGGQQWDAARRHVSMVFDVPPQGCPGQRLGLHVDGGGMDLSRLALDHAVLTAITL